MDGSQVGDEPDEICLDVSADGNSVLPGSKEDKDERRPKFWTWKELLVEGKTVVCEGIVKVQTNLAIVVD